MWLATTGVKYQNQNKAALKTTRFQ